MRLRYFFILISSTCLFACTNNQVEDPYAKGANELGEYLQEALRLMRADEYDSAIVQLQFTDSIAKVYDNRYTQSSVFSNYGWIANRLDLLDSAEKCYTNAIALDRFLNDSSDLMINLRQLSRVQRALSKFSDAATSLEEVIDIAGVLNDTLGVASASNLMGNVFIELLEYEKALKYYKTAAKNWGDANSKANRAIAIHNQGDALRGMGQLDSALATYKRALDLKRELNRTSSSAYTLTGLGRTYLLMDSIGRAEEVLNQAIAIRRELRNKNSYAESLLILSRVSVARGQYRKAENQLKEVEQIARGNNKADLLRDAFEDQRALYKKWNRLADLARVDELYDIMTDSLYREEKLKVQEAQAAANLQREQQRTQLAQQDAELAQLEADAESQKAFFRLVLVIIAALGLVVIAWQLLQIRKRNASLIALNARIKLITDNAFHSQKNALGLISALLRSKARQADNETELEVLQEVEGKIEALGGVAKSLFQRRIEDNTAIASKIQLKSYLKQLVDDTWSSVASEAELDMEVDDIETTSTQALNVGLITNEAVTNFSKYAEPKGAEMLVIRVLQEAENLLLTFVDDGPGFPDGFDFSNSTGFGMQMMANLVGDMDGQISLNREDDLTQIEIHIPIKS